MAGTGEASAASTEPARVTGAALASILHQGFREEVGVASRLGSHLSPLSPTFLHRYLLE